jgi:hypothetical protein
MRPPSTQLSVAIAITLLTGMVCWLGIRAELKTTHFSIRTHLPRSNPGGWPYPEIRCNSVLPE